MLEAMGSIVRRTAALLCVLAFAQGTLLQCTGWQATPEARRQCCQGGACPLQHRQDTSARTVVTQAAADDCCASSSRHDSSPIGASIASFITLAVLQPLAHETLTLSANAPLSPAWEAPSPPPHVPKHLLLSVLLV
jgi:hypothetical protein